MFDIRLRVYSDNAVRGRVLKTVGLTVTDTDSATPRVSFSVSRRVAGYLSNPFLVGVEVSYGGAWVTPRNNLFICTEEDGDDSDDSETVSFTGAGFVPWLMQYMYVQGTQIQRTGQRIWANATPGTIFKALINEAKAWGWGPLVSFDFTETHDSNGSAWTAAERTNITWRVGYQTMSDVLANLSDQGIIEWWAEGTNLRVFRAGIGTDRSSKVALGGAGFSRTPRKSSFDGVFTKLTVFYDGAYVNVTNEGSDGRFGALWATMTQSGVKTQAEAVKLSQPALTMAKGKREELSYEWDGATNLPAPVRDFNIGDVVTARQRDGKRIQRVVGWVFRKTDSGVTIRVVVGSKLLSLTAKLAKRSAAASVGTIIGGSGDAFPPHRGPADPAPMPPEGLRVVSSESAWAKDGSAVATVKLAWYAVSQSVDGTPLDVVEYEVWAREADELPSFVARAKTLETTVNSWRPPTTQFVSVRARSAGGEWSELSAEIAVTPTMPASIIPAVVTGLQVVSNVGSFRADGSAIADLVVGWDAVTLSIEGEPLDIDRYEVRLKRGHEDAPFATSASTEVAFTLAAGEDATLTVHARSVKGVWGDYSIPLDVIGATPAQDTSPPSAPMLTSSLGMAFIAWDGLLESGAPAAGFQHVIVEVSIDDQEFIRVGAPLAAQGSSNVRGLIGSVVTVRFFPVDTLGRVGSVSNISQITVVGVVGADIEANSILTNHIEAGSITASLLAADIGQSLDISSNESINLLVTAQGETQDALDTLSLWFRVDGEGAHIGEAGNPFQAHMRPEGFAITDNGVETTWWESGRMVVPSLVTEEVVLSNHKFEKYGTGTVIRAV